MAWRTPNSSSVCRKQAHVYATAASFPSMYHLKPECEAISNESEMSFCSQVVVPDRNSLAQGRDGKVRGSTSRPRALFVLSEVHMYIAAAHLHMIQLPLRPAGGGYVVILAKPEALRRPRLPVRHNPAAPQAPRTAAQRLLSLSFDTAKSRFMSSVIHCLWRLAPSTRRSRPQTQQICMATANQRAEMYLKNLMGPIFEKTSRSTFSVTSRCKLPTATQDSAAHQSTMLPRFVTCPFR